MTQLTGSPRITRQNALQIVAVVAIAAVGISFGRWIVPAGDASSGSSLGASDTSTVSVAETIAERHFEQRGGYGEAEVLGAVVAPVDGSAAETIAQRHFELRGGYGELDAPATVSTTVSAPADGSAAETIAQRHFELRGGYGELELTSQTEGTSAAETIAQRKFESGRLDEILFGGN